MEMALVTKQKFYATVGQMNVMPRSERDRTFWETPARQIVGISTPGYLCEGAETYALSRSVFPVA